MAISPGQPSEPTDKTQALFDHDNDTGRVATISMQGLSGAGAFFTRWLSQMPNDITRHIKLVDPGVPDRGSDNVSFICHGVPAFSLSSVSWDYETYTWHTNRDTFDKLILDDLKNNAALFAMLATWRLRMPSAFRGSHE